MRVVLTVRNPVVLVSLVIFCCLTLLALYIHELRWIETEHIRYHQDNVKGDIQTSALTNHSPVFVTFSLNVNNSGHLKHVFDMFHYFGFVQDTLTTDGHWDVLWAHDYPFEELNAKLKSLKPYQMVNHFPGSGYITVKRTLATTNISYIPRAFKIPEEKQQFLDYVKKYPKKTFVQKRNAHRGIKIETLDTLDLKSDGIFVQEYIDEPFLVDGYKFDIGVYTIISSVDPLRVYIYNGDILFRYCREKYHPFDPKDINKYVVEGNYLPTWEIPALRRLYKEFGYSMRDSFNEYVIRSGKDPNKIWEQIEKAIQAVCLTKEPYMIKLLSAFPSKRNFFEMVRFDFVVDEDLNVYIMEANMSPNLASFQFTPNRLLYEQVLFNLFHLVGLASKINMTDMEAATKNVMVSASVCASEACASCMDPQCLLCLPCLTPDTLYTLRQAHREHTSRHECKRVFPPTMTPESAKNTDVIGSLSPENQLMFRWFQAKCLQDASWC